MKRLSDNIEEKESLSGWRRKLHEIIFEADTKSGKFFDVALIIAIIISVIVVMLDSVSSLRAEYGRLFTSLEWFFTILFTIEYILRIICVGNPLHYITSFFGIVDLLAILPTYVGLIFPGGHYFVAIRILRVLRVFRVLKIVQYLGAANKLKMALIQSRRKIFVFLFVVFVMVIIFGSIMYVIEGEENGFTSIPKSIYWAIVTLTTVGYGDISPQTPLGQAIASIIMILGYGIIAVPTGIVTTEMARGEFKPVSTQACPNCSREGHETDAVYCKYCGSKL